MLGAGKCVARKGKEVLIGNILDMGHGLTGRALLPLTTCRSPSGGYWVPDWHPHWVQFRVVFLTQTFRVRVRGTSGVHLSRSCQGEAGFGRLNSNARPLAPVMSEQWNWRSWARFYLNQDRSGSEVANNCPLPLWDEQRSPFMYWLFCLRRSGGLTVQGQSSRFGTCKAWRDRK